MTRGATRGTARGTSRGRSPKAGAGAPRPLTWQDARVEATASGWHFILPSPERVNAIWRHWRGRVVSSEKHRADKAAAPLLFRHVVPLPGDVVVRLVWVRANKQGDVDGRIKATLDLLKGIAYYDDAQVVDLRIIRVDDGSPARMEVFVFPADEPEVIL